jgi:hypothetical protein
MEAWRLPYIMRLLKKLNLFSYIYVENSSCLSGFGQTYFLVHFTMLRPIRQGYPKHKQKVLKFAQQQFETQSSF